MSAETEFYLGAKASNVELELYEISHPNFSQVYRTQRQVKSGVTVTLETGEEAAFDYVPMAMTEAAVTGDLDYKVQIDFGDLGEILPLEYDRVAAADGFGVKPVLVLRVYRSDVLTAPMIGPLRLQIDAFTGKGEGTSFAAGAPSLNVNKTGESYTLDRFTMMRGAL